MKQLFCLLAIFVLTTETCTAHPNHIGMAEVEWNAKTGRFEVAMKLRIADLEDAISMMNKRRWKLEGATDQKQQLLKYLGKHFSITQKGHQSCKLHWVGSELLLHDVWIYFEAQSVGEDAPSSEKESVSSFDELLSPEIVRSGITIRHTALMEIQPEQTHVVAMLKEGRRTAFAFNRRQDTALFDGSQVSAVKR